MDYRPLLRTVPPLSAWLRAQMKERGLAQAALSASAGVGAGTLNDILTKGHVPKVETLFHLADALDTSHLEILLVAGHLRRADELATGRKVRPEVADYWVQEILDLIRRVPEEWRQETIDDLARAIVPMRTSARQQPGDPFLGTQLHLLERALNAVADSVEESAMDSVFLEGDDPEGRTEPGQDPTEQLLDEFRRIPDHLKPLAPAILRILAGLRTPKELPPDPDYFSPDDDLRASHELSQKPDTACAAKRPRSHVMVDERSQDAAPRGEKRDMAGYAFEWVTSIQPRRKPSGEIAQQVYDQPGERLNRYGAGPFCRVDFPTSHPFAGVYAIVVDDQVTYVGECKNLSIRFGPLGYGHITARNCLHNGQATNCRVNALILEQCLSGKQVSVWFLRTRKRHQIEEELRGLLRPPWNRQLGPRRPAPLKKNRADRTTPTVEDFRRVLNELFVEAAKRGDAAVTVNAGDLHRQVGGYPGTGHRMATCCNVMHAEAGPADVVLESPPSGNGASLTLQYRLPRHR